MSWSLTGLSREGASFTVIFILEIFGMHENKVEASLHRVLRADAREAGLPV